MKFRKIIGHFAYSFILQNIDAETLLRRPGLYSKIAKNRLLALPEFCTWLAFGVWHSLGQCRSSDHVGS